MTPHDLARLLTAPDTDLRAALELLDVRALSALKTGVDIVTEQAWRRTLTERLRALAPVAAPDLPSVTFGLFAAVEGPGGRAQWTPKRVFVAADNVPQVPSRSVDLDDAELTAALAALSVLAPPLDDGSELYVRLDAPSE
ncbi:hypothetical protein [Streptomyces sp. NBC_00268]|uniref:hypothetical protein n=1 Tax=Streptomyces sp. NBC_00268 TaxID=2975695 RepID=UPI002257A90B|nr:hypothetical protein [Streptomyces sp. NBC_00268]MCX5182593.1 hypothetical protein [Streptomyces sp. NBC_00268]